MSSPPGLAFGVVAGAGHPASSRIVVRDGDGRMVDVASLVTAQRGPHPELLTAPGLDALLGANRPIWTEVTQWLRSALSDPDRTAPHRLPDGVPDPVLPFTVADYVDFYSSEHHARNVGEILRGTRDLNPNWTSLPVGYHGRAGTVVVSGTDVRRPRGQVKDGPAYVPTAKLDIEAEIGFVVGVPSTRGTPVRPADWRQHVFGVVLLNDWSARDVQAWEGQPLGPFLAKSFLTSISPWVVPLAALEGAFAEAASQDSLDYLQPPGPALDLRMEVRLNGHVISRPRGTDLYWTAAQQLAHLTANGASLRTGDLYASGTVSGPDRDTRGCLLELSWNGTDPLELPDGTTRTFLEDGDTVTITATAPGGVDFGEVTGTVTPA